MEESTGTRKRMEKNRGLTVGQWVARYPQTARIFESRGIDYCCRGNRSLEEACARNGKDPSALRAELAEALEQAPSSPDTDWNKEPLETLINHIESVHHRFLREEKPRLIALAHKVAAVHGDRHPELVELDSKVDLIFRELDPHLDREEQVEFPAIRNWETAGRKGDGLPDHLEALEDEHIEVGRILENIRDITSGFRPPPDACNSYLALFHGLEQLEADLHSHIHKENNILHARIRAATAPKATDEGCSFCGE